MSHMHEEPRAWAYTPLYCEENIWKLVGDVRLPPGERRVLVISNPQRTVALGAQRAGRGGVVVWDYHVVLALRTSEGGRVFDLDSTLPLGCPLADYLPATFGEQHLLPPPLRALIRVLEGDGYAQQLSSNRQHMMSPEGDWMALPPPWPAPVGSGRTWPLMELIDMSRKEPGRVVSPDQLEAALGEGPVNR